MINVEDKIGKTDRNLFKSIMSISRVGMQNISIFGVFLVFVVELGGIVSAAPVIVSWGNNYTNNQDIMFLVNQSDIISFSATVNRTVGTYQWSVNKVDQDTDQDHFTWNVPNDKGIWEIHLMVNDSAGYEDHLEWVISTLNSSEAPDIFDYFSDGKYNSRSDTDPWDRPLREWLQRGTAPDVSKFFLQHAGAANAQNYLEEESTVRYGTWKYCFAVPEGTDRVYPSFYPITNNSWDGLDYNQRSFGFTWDSSGYLRLNARYNASYGIRGGRHSGWWMGAPNQPGLFDYYLLDSPSYTGVGREWFCTTLIHDEDGYWNAWMTGRPDDRLGDYVSWSYRWFDAEPNFFYDGADIDNISTNIAIYLAGVDPSSTTLLFDNVEVYNYTYLYPSSDIQWYDTVKVSSKPRNISNTIVVTGWDNTLQKINDSITDPSKFMYYPNGTAYVYTNLTLWKGAKLTIENETILFNSTNGTQGFKVMTGSYLKIINSTINNKQNSFYYLAFDGRTQGSTTGSSAFWGYTTESARDGTKLGYNYGDYHNGYIEIVNSSIANATLVAGISPRFGRVTNTVFSDIWRTGEVPWQYNEIREDACGSKCNTEEWWGWFSNITINVRSGDANKRVNNPVGYKDVRITGNPIVAFWNVADITNYDLTDANVQWSLYSTVNITLYNYLDVLVQWDNGTAIEGANVSVENEVDSDVKPLSLAFNASWVASDPGNCPTGDEGNPCNSKRVNNRLVSTSTLTSSDGHTPLPNNITNTFVIAERKQWDVASINYTYNVTACYNSICNSIMGVDPNESWYRSNPNTYQNTIVITLENGGDTTPPAITFFRSTPANGSILDSNYIDINVTLSEAPDWVALEWNGINETMNGSGTNWYKNKMNLSNGTYGYMVFANDSAGNMNVSETRVVTIAYSPPPPDTIPPSITIQSPENRTHANGTISLNYVANEALDICLVSVDGTANATLLDCENQAVISREYESTMGISGWWHFNEGSGSSASDESGNGMTGVVNGSSWVDGKFGKALNFDGLDDYVEVVSPSLNLTNQITLETWIKTPIIGRHTILDKWLYGTGVDQRSFELDVDSDGRINFGLSSDGTSTNAVWLKSAGAVSTNAWTHIAAVSDGTTMKIYINGEQDQSTATAPSAIYSSTANLNIGRWFTEGTWWNPFNGTIDEVRLLNMALTEDEIKADYALGAGSHNITVYADDTSGNWNYTTRYFTVLYSHTLSKGWNTVNFTGDNNTPVESSLSAVDYYVMWDQTGDIPLSYTKEIGWDFSNLTFGREYRIYTWSNTTWTYPVP